MGYLTIFYQPTKNKMKEPILTKEEEILTSDMLYDSPIKSEEKKRFLAIIKSNVVKEERNRLKKKAKEYKAKGFELETFIYSGFINPNRNE